MSEFIKLGVPVVLVLYWLYKAYTNQNEWIAFPALFFTSVAAFSQNFTFFYREMHQLLQLMILFLCLLNILQTKTTSIVIKPLFIFMVFIILSLVNNQLDSDSISQTLNYLIVFFVLLFLFGFLKSHVQLFQLMHFIGSLSLILAFFALLEFLLTGAARVEVTFANPNYLALFLGVGFVCIYYFHIRFKWLFLLLILLSIVLTGSRSALAIPFLVVIWGVLKEGFSIRKLSMITLTIIFMTLYIGHDSNRFEGGKLSGSDAERVLFAKIALDMTEDNLWTGVGWGRFIGEFSNYSSSVKAINISDGKIDVSRDERRVTHNDFLRIASELGVFSFVTSCLFIIWTLFILITKRAYGFDFIVPIFGGMLLFSLTHNNLNTAFSWFFILMPYFIHKCSWEVKRASNYNIVEE